MPKNQKIRGFRFSTHTNEREEMQPQEKVILVTGGSGLVGKAIEWVLENETNPRFARQAEERWIFLTSKDGDLRSAAQSIQNQPFSCSDLVF